jgi:hypothetical protein
MMAGGTETGWRLSDGGVRRVSPEGKAELMSKLRRGNGKGRKECEKTDNARADRMKGGDERGEVEGRMV